LVAGNGKNRLLVVGNERQLVVRYPLSVVRCPFSVQVFVSGNS
jgi:hypothetical protein